MIREGRAIKLAFTKKPAQNFRLLVFAVVSLVLLAADRRGAIGALRGGLDAAVYPLQQFVSAPVRFAEWLRENVSGYASLLEENQRLKEESLRLEARLAKFSALEQENIRLRALLGASIKIGEHFLIAELLSINLVPYEHLVLANKGSNIGVHVGQPVFDARGVVGQVLRVSPVSAEVMLITDPNHAIPVQVERNGLRTIAVGTGRIDRLILPYLSGSADIREGDRLVTSGMGGVFPAGYPVATVVDISNTGSSLAKVSAEPVAPLDRIREVLLVWTRSDVQTRDETGESPSGAAAPHVAH
ncbi:rod shape-determining protein MreC [Methylococcus capsulatus]|uniref:Cell shape-determining protein MreC n=1 Tax=Methylococcus capsulatus (strain ATCC 33009 / NCIMB 11132 / Bath) TaxID=243233 RepID=Q60CK5_METCA|nr:rod shape-determining protein MreC [Methylococcus capsulatus]AAU90719.1 rod shape-determining protein MreC [Methylococcus capsulatus str. Bath]QXP89383.1 rod shape-determining protein MreC [Methylococcus capsulatus]